MWVVRQRVSALGGVGLLLQPHEELIAEQKLVERLIRQGREGRDVVHDHEPGVVEFFPDTLEEFELVFLVRATDEQEVDPVTALLGLAQDAPRLGLVTVATVGHEQHDRLLADSRRRSCGSGRTTAKHPTEEATGFCRSFRGTGPAEVLDGFPEDAGIFSAAVVAWHLLDDLATHVVIDVRGRDRADVMIAAFAGAEREDVQCAVGIEGESPRREPDEDVVGETATMLVVKRHRDIEDERNVRRGRGHDAFFCE